MMNNAVPASPITSHRDKQRSKADPSLRTALMKQTATKKTVQVVNADGTVRYTSIVSL